MLGWVLDIPALADWDRNGINMKPNAALCAMAAGGALVAITLARGRGLVRPMAVFVSIVGVLTLFEHAASVNLGKA